ncbi:protein nbr1 like [Fagus crenata]
MINLARTKTITTPALLLSLFVSFYGLLSYTDQITGCSALYMWMLPYVGFVLMVALVIVVARATMVTWITLLVLLAFAGNRRRVLAKHGRKITADVAMHLVRVVLKERGLVAMACVTIVSLMAWIA